MDTPVTILNSGVIFGQEFAMRELVPSDNCAPEEREERTEEKS